MKMAVLRCRHCQAKLYLTMVLYYVNFSLILELLGLTAMNISSKKILTPKRQRVLSAQQYLQDVQLQRNNIKDVEFIPPKIGSNRFGSFRVRYHVAILD